MDRKRTHVELDEAQGIVPVVMLSQIRLNRRDANSSHALDLGVLAEEPQGQIDIVDRTVDENTAGELGVRHEKATRIQLVACLRSEHGWGADVTRRHAPVRIAI